MNNTEHDDDWQAFLYLAGEMSAEESAAFELRLAQDQSAREALARSVQFTGAVASACRPVSVAVSAAMSQRSWGRVVAVCAAAALVLVAVSFGLFDGDRSDIAKPSVVTHRTAGKNVDGLVAFWNESGNKSSSRDAEYLDEGHLASADFDPNSLAYLDASDLSVPSWMLAAVAGDPQTKLPNNPTERHEDN